MLLSSARGLVAWGAVLCTTAFECLARGKEIPVSLFWVACYVSSSAADPEHHWKGLFLSIKLCITLLLTSRSVFEAL